jgi:serine/threonine-protein kinase
VGVAAAALIAAGGLFLTRQGAKPKTAAQTPAASLQQSVSQALPMIGCSWLEAGEVQTGAGGAVVRLKGVAGRPATAQAAITAAATNAGVTLTDLDLNEVAPVGEALCAPLDVFRPLKSTGADGLSLPQRRFEIRPQPGAAKPSARAVINLHLPDPQEELALVGLEPNGKMTLLIHNRAEFDKLTGSLIKDEGGGSYRLEVFTDHTGWSGMLLITGRARVDPQLVEGDAASRDAAWPESFRAAAAQGGWKTDMVWYRTVTAGG